METPQPRSIERVSIFTGAKGRMTILMTDSQYKEIIGFIEDRFSARHIQDILPTTSDEEREFILSGSTPEEWNSLLGSEEEDY